MATYEQYVGKFSALDVRDSEQCHILAEMDAEIMRLKELRKRIIMEYFVDLEEEGPKWTEKDWIVIDAIKKMGG